MRWLCDHFEVRWITSWCPGGEMREDRLLKLARLLGVDADELRAMRNPRPFPARPFGGPAKHRAVDFDEAREKDLLSLVGGHQEVEINGERLMLSAEKPDALLQAQRRLALPPGDVPEDPGINRYPIAKKTEAASEKA